MQGIDLNSFQVIKYTCLCYFFIKDGLCVNILTMLGCYVPQFNDKMIMIKNSFTIATLFEFLKHTIMFS